MQPDQVAGPLHRQTGGQGAALGQVAGQRGGAGQPLAVDGGRELLEVRLAGAGGGQQDAGQGPARSAMARERAA
jgi:hypothetical protein